MSNPGRKTRKIQIWASVDSFLTASDLSIMSFDKVKEQADNHNIAYSCDISQVDLITLLLGGQESISELNNLGQQVIKDRCIKSVMAEIVPQTGSLLVSRPANTVLSKTTHKIIIWYNPHLVLLPKINWIIYKNHRFEIDYLLNPYFANVDLEIYAEEICNGSGF